MDALKMLDTAFEGPGYDIAGLPLCLAVVILPPLLAVLVSGLAAFFQRQGHALLHCINMLGLGLAYLAQAAMIAGTLACVYFSPKAYTIHDDPRMPSSLVTIYHAVLSLAVALGVFVLTMVGLYAFEWLLSSSAIKHPKELVLVTLVVGWASFVGEGELQWWQD